MTTAFDPQGINDITVAIRREMTPRGAGRMPDADTLFMGGTPPSDADENELGLFGQRKNYRIVFASFEPADAAAGPTAFHAVVTDGVAETFVLSGGRLWKRDRRSASVLLFPDIRAVVKLSHKGRMVVREMAAQHHDHGYELALEAVRDRAAHKPGHAPVVSPIGGMVTVLDMKALADTFANAA